MGPVSIRRQQVYDNYTHLYSLQSLCNLDTLSCVFNALNTVWYRLLRTFNSVHRTSTCPMCNQFIRTYIYACWVALANVSCDSIYFVLFAFHFRFPIHKYIHSHAHMLEYIMPFQVKSINLIDLPNAIQCCHFIGTNASGNLCTFADFLLKTIKRFEWN